MGTPPLPVQLEEVGEDPAVVVGAGVVGVTDVVLDAVGSGVGEALAGFASALCVPVAGVCTVGAVAVVAAPDGAVVVVVGGAGVSRLATVTFPRRLDVVPSDQVSTAPIVCDPSARFVVS
jgi:hypothetical protein